MSRPSLHEAFTKIIATVGPACESVDMLRQLIDRGVDVFRINTAHGDRERMTGILERVRQASQLCGYPVGILLDLAGPKIRLGQLREDPLVCEHGKKLTFIRGTESHAPDQLTGSYK